MAISVQQDRDSLLGALPVSGSEDAVGGGMRYYLLLRFTPPRSVSAVLPPPPLWLVLEVAGLAAVALFVVAITLLILVAMVEVIVPGPIGRWLRARRTRRANSSQGQWSVRRD